MARKTEELFTAYRALTDEHLAMRRSIGASLRVFEREFRACRPEDEATLAAKFRAILGATLSRYRSPAITPD